MGTTKPKIEDLTPIMDRVERKLSACSTWLSYSRRLQMINSAITPIVTYTLCTIKVPKGFIENIDHARKQCLWRGSDVNAKGGNLVALAEYHEAQGERRSRGYQPEVTE